MSEQAKDDELMRRISDALDAEGGLDADPALRAQLDEDPAALSYAQDLVRIDEVLKGFGAQPSEPDWEAMASAIERRLDEALPPLEVEVPPRFDDEVPVDAPSVTVSPAEVSPAEVSPAEVSPADVSPAEVSPAELGPAGVRPVDVSQKVAVFSEPPERRSAEVVDLGARRARRNSVLAWMSGLAAAAAVGLVVSSGMITFDASPEVASIAENADYEDAEHEEEAARLSMAASIVGDDVRAGGPPAEEARAPQEGAAMPEPAPAAAEAQDLASDRAEGESLAGSGRGGTLDNGEHRARPSRRRARRLAPSPAPAQALPARTPSSQGTSSHDTLSGLGGLDESRPSRAEVLTSLRPAEPAVQRCLASVGEVASVGLRVGATGEIVSVTVSPPYGAADQRCIESALRAVRFAPSSEGYTLRHVFRPAPAAGDARRAAPAESSAAPASEL